MSRNLEHIKQLQQKYNDALQNYKIASSKLTKFYNEYTNIKEKHDVYLNRIFSLNGGEQYYITEDGVMKKVNAEMHHTCPQNMVGTITDNPLPSSVGLMMNVTPDYVENNESEDNLYFIRGTPMKAGQPCADYNTQFSVNMPDKSDYSELKECSYADSHMIEHSDLNMSSLNDCRIRAEDMGHAAYGLVDYNTSSKSGTCYTGDKDKIQLGKNAHKIETKSIATTSATSCSMTLLKDGSLIMWSGGGSYKTSDNALDASKIEWTSKSNGGTTDSSCHPVFGGSINTIDVNYGTNCGLSS